MNQLPKALLFDMDGLLLDTEGVYKRSWSAAASALGYDITNEIYLTLIGITIADCEKRLVKQFGAAFPLEIFRGDARNRYEQIIAAEGIPLKPGVHAILEWARARKIPCGLGTSTLTEEAVNRLRKHGISDHFIAVVGGDQVTHGKPDPETYLKVAEKMRVDPADCIVFEDAHSGVRAACAAGMSVALIPDLLPSTDEIAAMAVGVFPSLDHTVEWLATLQETAQ